MYTVTVRSQSGQEIEWTEKFQAKTMAAAKGMATRWINKNLFVDADDIDKDQWSETSAWWTIR